MAIPLAQMWRRGLTIAAVPAVLLLAPPAVSADPIVITGGTVETFLTSGYPILIGDDFRLSLNVQAFTTPLSECNPCVPGQTADAGGSFVGPSASGFATVDGVFYNQIYTDGLTGTFTTGTFTLDGPSTFAVPFTYNAVINGYLTDPFVTGYSDPVFTKTLTGQGTAVAFFTESNGLLFANGTRYLFSGPDPTPEPGTLLLCGTALLAGAVRKRRRKESRRNAS